jgi:hypothetical protein
MTMRRSVLVLVVVVIVIVSVLSVVIVVVFEMLIDICESMAVDVGSSL